MKYLHKWKTVKDTGKYEYLICEKCGDKSVRQIISGGHQPVNNDWVDKKPSLLCK